MSVLKTKLANPSRMRGIFRYLLQVEGQRQKREILEQLLSPEKLAEGKTPSRPMFNAALNESLKCKLLIEVKEGAISINPELPQLARDPELGDDLLPDTLMELFFNSDNEDEFDFGLDCAWYLAQDIYDAIGTWEEVEKRVSEQKVAESLDLKLSSNTLFGHLEDWMSYFGLTWRHSLNGKKVAVADPTVYIRRNLEALFNGQSESKLSLKEFMDRLAKRCPLFETGKFREKIEEKIGRRPPNYLSTSTAFALFRLKDEGYIDLRRESDAELMILPKANQTVDDESRVSHIIWTP
ncbi:hypothetical protein K4A83_07005 [Spirulina subsalsa FACHB-351]|uniref:Uncharacterized protein n=1 Tax=Spirulina subsalsa FACHB-351 TaxID=234711 RepID=A0ABT3L3D5_9CYAN|nr:protein DpdG [Spirulina subsalsa]MCW6036020.1 hypothetical protein [Spirulina subsalsa FACHB-351]